MRIIHVVQIDRGINVARNHLDPVPNLQPQLTIPIGNIPSIFFAFVLFFPA